MRRLGSNKMHRAQSQRCAPLFLGQGTHGTRGVGRKTEGFHQREQRAIGHLPASTEPIRITLLDPDKPSDVFDRGAVVHLTGASTPVPARVGSATSAFRSWTCTLGLRSA